MYLSCCSRSRSFSKPVTAAKALLPLSCPSMDCVSIVIQNLGDALLTACSASISRLDTTRGRNCSLWDPLHSFGKFAANEAAVSLVWRLRIRWMFSELSQSIAISCGAVPTSWDGGKWVKEASNSASILARQSFGPM